MALTDKQARSAKPSDKPYKLADTLSLYLLVKPNGFRIWYFKYRFEGKESGVSFGPYPETSLRPCPRKTRCHPARTKIRLYPFSAAPGRKKVVNELERSSTSPDCGIQAA